ncbi:MULTISPECIES: hypothetical protein [Brevibacillus]|uniref:hypothetical protein n=1 Tax=Brevibacillus TaxID=55080 RepID=UPI001E622440|nr:MULTISPECIES: hypothetical protein [Brevibacillus]MDH6352351.1 hypothetical protein [Brevibacillus sp. 1238]MED2255209.1 hypothetical protein [Brevibacillus parabrevis]UED70007.1 hypothetical protein HP435_04990 [Brevibacillus sp. HD3.3A]WDV96306.1 hypothetical protein PSE45_04920 [Brevibacillus parabrevis]
MAVIPIPDPQVEAKKKRVLVEEQAGVDKYNLEHSELVEVSKGHWGNAGRWFPSSIHGWIDFAVPRVFAQQISDGFALC